MVGMLALGRKSLSSRATGTGWTPDADWYCFVREEERGEEPRIRVQGKEGIGMQLKIRLVSKAIRMSIDGSESTTMIHSMQIQCLHQSIKDKICLRKIDSAEKAFFKFDKNGVRVSTLRR